MDPLQELLEIEAIKALKYKYMRSIDCKLWDEMRECFTPDATTSSSGGKYSFEGIEAIMNFMTESMSRGSSRSSASSSRARRCSRSLRRAQGRRAVART